MSATTHTARSENSVLNQLRQLHAAERAQMSELRVLRSEVGIASVAASLDQHLSATANHGDLLDDRLAELASAPSLVNLVETFGSSMVKGVVERLRPHNACDVLRDAIAGEAAELIDYLMLQLDAIRAGDTSTTVLAQAIAADEREMIEVLRTYWHQAVRHDLDTLDEPGESHHAGRGLLIRHLQLAHATARGALGGLTLARYSARDETIAARLDDHHAETARHAQLLLERLHELHASGSIRFAMGKVAVALMNVPLVAVHGSDPRRSARALFVNEHVETAVLDQLVVLAEAVGDDRTVAIGERMRLEDRSMIDWIERSADVFVLG